MLDSIREKLKWLDPFTYVDLWVMPKLNPENHSLRSWLIYIFFAALFAFIIYNAIGLVMGTSFPLVIVLSGSMEPEYYRGDIIVLQGVNPETLNAPVIELNHSLKNVPSYEYLQTYCSANNSPDIALPCDHFKLQVLNRQTTLIDFSTTELHFLNGEKLSISKEGATVVYFSSQQQKPIIHRTVAVLKTLDGTYVLTKGDSPKNPLIDQEAGITFFATPVSELQGQALFKIPLLGYVKLILIDDPMQIIMGCPYEEGCILP